MIYDLRTYTLHPGKMKEYLDIYEQEALPCQQEHLGRLVAYFMSDVGSLNQAIHIWEYRDVEDRERRREKMFADDRFVSAAAKLYPLIQKQENQLVKGARFSPLR